MTRIAVISDVHSNMTALEAVLKSIEKNNIDYIYGIGDIIGKGPSPVEALELCKKSFDTNILGNWEDFIIHSNIAEEPILYYREKLSDVHFDYLKSLGYNIEFYLSGHLVRLFHAHPNDVYKRVFSFSDLQIHTEMFEPPTDYPTQFPEVASDVVVYGDIHYPYQIHFNEPYYDQLYQRLKIKNNLSVGDFDSMYRAARSQLKGKYLLNTGSVGLPFDGTQATYVILEGELHAKEKKPFAITYVRVDYDTITASQIALASTMYDKYEYSKEILTGVFRGRKKVDFTMNK